MNDRRGARRRFHRPTFWPTVFAVPGTGDPDRAGAPGRSSAWNGRPSLLDPDRPAAGPRAGHPFPPGSRIRPRGTTGPSPGQPAGSITVPRCICWRARWTGADRACRSSRAAGPDDEPQAPASWSTGAGRRRAAAPNRGRPGRRGWRRPGHRCPSAAARLGCSRTTIRRRMRGSGPIRRRWPIGSGAGRRGPRSRLRRRRRSGHPCRLGIRCESTSPTNHLDYALTWLRGLAAVLVAIYIAFHWRRPPGD